MAKKDSKPKTVLERQYNVPLRKEWLKTPKYKRAKKAVTALKQFLIKHMKPGLDEKGKIQVKIGKYLNEHLWKHGMKNPPHHVKITTTKEEKGVVLAELEGAPVEKEKPKKEKKKLTGKLGEEIKKVIAGKGAVEEKKEEPKGAQEKAVEEKKEETREEEKEELEAVKKEEPKEPPKEPAVEKKVEKKVTGPANR